MWICIYGLLTIGSAHLYDTWHSGHVCDRLDQYHKRASSPLYWAAAPDILQFLLYLRIYFEGDFRDFVPSVFSLRFIFITAPMPVFIPIYPTRSTTRTGRFSPERKWSRLLRPYSSQTEYPHSQLNRKKFPLPNPRVGIYQINWHGRETSSQKCHFLTLFISSAYTNSIFEMHTSNA